MKPISLTVAGLHSFREKQHVDFAQLCAGGVFGIFGPTGSGKSSLLDAITLALYGKVERAPNSTQGIINHAEDELSVSFTFELANAAGEKRYKVERRFKKSGENGVNTSYCRLIDVTAQPVVLADKAQEVNRQVIALLGLTSEDFTRAVVLPQGKFAEFLALRGVERRQMLQRLFNLEKYGDQLRKTLNRRWQDENAQLNEVRAEQAGLGDASASAVEAAEQHFQKCEQRVRQAEQQVKLLEKEHEVLEKRWGWQAELMEIKKELSTLSTRQKEIDELKERIKRAELAERLVPYLEEYEISQQEADKWQLAYKKAEQDLQQAKQEEEQASEAYETARKNRNDLEPKWRVRLEQLNEAKGMTERLQQLKGEADKLNSRLTDLRQTLREKVKKLETENDLKVRGEKRQQEIKAEIVRNQVPFAQKEKVYRAEEEYREIRHLEKQMSEQEQTYRQAEAGLLKAEHEAARLEEKLARHREQLSRLIQDNQQYLRTIDECQHHCQQLSRAIEKEQQAIQEAQAEERMANLAWELAQSLREGSPCPVCGATDHPAPTQHQVTSVDHDEAADRLAKLAAWHSDLVQAVNRLHALKWGVNQLGEQLDEPLLHDMGTESEATGIALINTMNEALLEATATTGMAGEPEAEAALINFGYHQLEREVPRLIERIKVVEDQLQHHEDRVKQALNEMTVMSRSTEQQELKVKIAVQEKEELAQKLKEIKERLQSEIQRWQSNFPDLAMEQISRLKEKYQQQEATVEKLRQRLEKSVPFLEEKEREIQWLNEEINHLKVEEAQLSTQHANKIEDVNEQEEQLKRITKGQPLSALLDEAEQTLRSLIAAEQKTKEIYEERQLKRQEAAQRRASTKQAWEQAEQRLQTALSKWEERLSASPFQKIDEVKQAVLTQEQQGKAQRSIAEYEDRYKQLCSQADQLEAKLVHDGPLSEEEFDASIKRLEEAKDEAAQAREEQGAAKHSLDEVRAKHVRYTQLKQKEEELSVLVAQLDTLQQVLRGNALVEFLAEEQLVQVSRDASGRLQQLTRGRYALEVDSGGGFIVRDDANGGVKRPVSSLSGGETFLTSLALALSLSASIQLRGEFPLQFFFLDEGFGTLDQDLLDTVVTALERLQADHMAIGVISHVPELRARLPRKLIVDPAEPGGRGSRVRMEML